MNEPLAINLRSITDSDSEFIYQGLSNPLVNKFYGVRLQSEQDTASQMDWYNNLDETKTGKWWILDRVSDNASLGAAGFNNLELGNKKVEIGFWLLPEFWGQGFLKTILPLLTSEAQRLWDVHRIEAFVEGGNDNCKKALIKNGFVHEGTMRDSEIKDGNYIDIDLFSQLI